MTFSAVKSYLGYFAAVAILAAIYVVTAKFGLTLAYVHPSATTIWAPTGISIVALLLFGYRYWPGIFMGAFLANISTEGTILTSFGIAVGNTLEAAACTYLMLTFAEGRNAFLRTFTVVTFTASVLASAAISASIGVATLTLGGFANPEAFQSIWLAWWLGDVGGALVVAPFILLWWNNFRVEWSVLKTLEIFGIIATLFGTAYIVFGPVNFQFDFLVAPVLVWLIMRFSTREAVSGMLLMSALAIGGTLQGYGPFSIRPPNESLLYLQAFIIVAAISTLILSALVSERRRVEKALQEADHAKDEFLASLSHELRNPLASIFSYVQLLQFGNRTSEEEKTLDFIKRELLHTTALLEDLLDLSRIRRGRMVLREENIEMASLMQEIAEGIKPQMKEREHAFEVHCSAGPMWIRGDRSRVKQVVVNLLTNAAKYTDPGGSVRVTCHPLESSISISVKDTGVGIGKERLSRIFDTNISATQFLGHARAGLGIGLALVKRLVGMHRGTLEVESEGVGKGSTFTVTFPLVRQSEIPTEVMPASIRLPAERKKQEGAFPRSVIVVDDNRKAANALVMLLQKHGYDARALYDGTSALHHIAAHPLNAVILDIALPDISGYEVAEKISAMALSSAPLLIALSGYGMEDDIRRSRESGFAHHLIKPVDVTVLNDILQQY